MRKLKREFYYHAAILCEILRDKFEAWTNAMDVQALLFHDKGWNLENYIGPCQACRKDSCDCG